MINRTSTKISVQLPDGRCATFTGRDAWALRHLVNAGNAGLTTLSQPAPRWSHYIYKLRRGGLVISTDYEAHSGDFPGNHGRYRLETPVTVVDGGTP